MQRRVARRRRVAAAEHFGPVRGIGWGSRGPAAGGGIRAPEKGKVQLGRRGRAVGGRRAAVVDEPWQQAPPAARVRGDPLRGREALGVLLEALDAEELRTNGLFGVREGIDRGTDLAKEAQDDRGF